MTRKNETETEVSAIVEAVKAWANPLIVGYLLGEDVTASTDDVRKVVEMIARVRETHDDAAKVQNAPTIRKVRNDSGVTAKVTDDERKAAAAAKAAALLG